MENFKQSTPKSHEEAEDKEYPSEQVVNTEVKTEPEQPPSDDIITIEGGFKARLPSAVDMETGLVCGTTSEFFQTREEAEQALDKAWTEIRQMNEIISLEKSYDKNFFRIEQTPDGGFMVYIPGLIDLKTGSLVSSSTGKKFDTWNEARDYYLEHREQAERITNRPIIEIQLTSDQKIAFSEFSGFNPDVAPSESTYEIPESILNYMTENGRLDGSDKSADTYQHTVAEKGWETELFSFLTSYLRNQGSEIAMELSIENLNALTPKQAVELSTQTVIDLTKYKKSDTKKRADEKTEADQSTALQLLKQGLYNKTYPNPKWEGNGVCRNFAGMVKAVFEALKVNQTKFSRLHNTYCLYDSGHEHEMKKEDTGQGGRIESGHAWNTFITVSKEGTANASIVDATWAERNLETKQIERFDVTLDRMEPLVFATGMSLSDENPNKSNELRRILSYYLMAIESPPYKAPSPNTLSPEDQTKCYESAVKNFSQNHDVSNISKEKLIEMELAKQVWIKKYYAEEFLAYRALELMRLQGVPEELPPLLIEKISEQYQKMPADKIDSKEIETLYKISQNYSNLNFGRILDTYIKKVLNRKFNAKNRFLVSDDDLQAIIFEHIKSDQSFDDFLSEANFRSRVRKVSSQLLPDFSPTTRPEDLKELNHLNGNTQGLTQYSRLSADKVNNFFKKLRTDLRLINPTRYDQEIKDLDDYQLVSRYKELKNKLASDSEINP